MIDDKRAKAIEWTALFILLVVAVWLLFGCASMSVAEKAAVGMTALDVGTTTYAAFSEGYREVGSPVRTALFGDELNERTAAISVATAVGAHFLLRYVAKRFDWQGAWWGYGVMRAVAGARNLRELSE